MGTGSQTTIPSFTGEPSGENATEVSLSTNGPYLIEAATLMQTFHGVALFRRS
jgi:hypothetical protein